MASKKKQEEAAFSWGELPSEVQSVVLGWLPLRHLFRCKSVCKLWNAIISAPTFTHFPSLLSRPTHPPWLIFTPKSFAFLLAFDFDSRSWFTFDLGFLSSMLSSMNPSSSTPSVQCGIVWCTGSASGLLLLDFCSSLHVCNPLTKSLFKLPPFRSIEVSITQGFSNAHIRSSFTNAETTERMPSHTHATGYDGMGGLLANTHMQNNGKQRLSSTISIRDNVQDADRNMCAHRYSHGYTLIAIGMAKSVLAIEVYCADRNSWDIVGSMPNSFVIRHDQMMECNGIFYSLLLEPLGMLVVGENNGKGGPIWRIQAMPANYGKETCRLLACQSAIFMVVCPGGEFHSLAIWRFQPDSRSWIKMHAMPDDILQDVKSISHSNYVDCIGVGNFICFRALCSLRVLTYNVCSEFWSWLPKPSHAYESFFARGLQFEPRLDYTPSL